MEEVRIKYFSSDYPRLKKTEVGDWVDLRADTIVEHHSECQISPQEDTRHYFAGDVIKVGLGVAMELPEGYEAIVAPRSSTFKHWGLMQTNGIGIDIA